MKKTDKQKAKEKKVSEYSKESTNPIAAKNIMPLNTRTSANRLYGGYANTYIKQQEVDYLEFIRRINMAFEEKKDSVELFYTLANSISQKFNLNFSVLGIHNSDSNCIDIKLVDKSSSLYNSKIMLNDSENPVVKAFKGKTIVHVTDSSYLKMNYIRDAQSVIIPLVALGECCGIIIFSDNDKNKHIEL